MAIILGHLYPTRGFVGGQICTQNCKERAIRHPQPCNCWPWPLSTVQLQNLKERKWNPATRSLQNWKTSPRSARARTIARSKLKNGARTNVAEARCSQAIAARQTCFTNLIRSRNTFLTRSADLHHGTRDTERMPHSCDILEELGKVGCNW